MVLRDICKIISMSRQRITHHIEVLGNAIVESLIAKAQKFSSDSIALNKTTDIASIAQTKIFACGVDYDFKITEELAAIVTIKGTTRGTDLLKTVVTIKCIGLFLLRPLKVTTDDTPSIAGSNMI